MRILAAGSIAVAAALLLAPTAYGDTMVSTGVGADSIIQVGDIILNEYWTDPSFEDASNPDGWDRRNSYVYHEGVPGGGAQQAMVGDDYYAVTGPSHIQMFNNPSFALDQWYAIKGYARSNIYDSTEPTPQPGAPGIEIQPYPRNAGGVLQPGNQYSGYGSD